MNKARASAGIAILVTAVLAAGIWRQVALGARAVAGCDAALAQGDRGAAIALARAAAEAQAPGSPYPVRGYERLQRIARDAEARGDDATAGGAFRAMRAAAVETRAIGTRTDAWRGLAEEGIARVGARAPARPGPGSDAAAPAPDPKAHAEPRLEAAALLEALRREETPPIFAFALLAAATAALFGGLGRIAWIAGDPDLRRRAKVPGAIAVAGLVLYAVACLR